MLPPTPIEMPPGSGSEMPRPTELQAVTSAAATTARTHRVDFIGSGYAIVEPTSSH